jgi:hypothetical protein
MTKRQILMPPAQGQNQLYLDLADATDEAFDVLGIDLNIEALRTLRQPFTISDMVVSEAEEQGKLVSLSQVTTQDLETLILSANMLGFRFRQSDIFTQEDFLRLVTYLGEYYHADKGTQSWEDFLGFALNAEFRVLNTWTEDYVHFYTEGDPAIGTPIHDGGTWYPTTHVVLEYDITRFAGQSASVVEFFYYFANINLVLWAIRLTQTAKMSLNVALHGKMTVVY